MSEERSATMIIHHPPRPTGRAVYIAATVFVLPLCILLVVLVPDAHQSALIIGFVLSPPLGLLFWRWFGKWKYVEEYRGGTERPRSGRAAPRYAFSRLEGAVFCSIVEDGPADAPVPGEIGVACLRRPQGKGLFWHPLMILQYVCAGAEIWDVLRGEWYSQCLALPAGFIFTLITLVWLVVGGTTWNVIAIKDGQAWVGDAELSVLRAREWKRITAADPADEGIELTLERQGKVRLWFLEGSLPAEVQRDLALDALRTHAGVLSSSEAEAGRATKPDEVSS